MSEVEKIFKAKLEALFEESYLSNFQKLACRKFIKDKVGNPANDEVKRLRGWLFMRINGQKLPEKYHPRQLGCPDLIPGLSLKGWWDRCEFDWVSNLNLVLIL